MNYKYNLYTMGARRHAVLGEKTEGQILGQRIGKKSRRHGLGQFMEKSGQHLYDGVGAVGQGFANAMEWTEGEDGKAARASTMAMTPFMAPQMAAGVVAGNVLVPAAAGLTRALRRPISDGYAHLNPKRQRR